MKVRRFVLPLCVTLLAAITFNLVLTSSVSRAANPADSNPALNEPDKFNWQLFIQINQKAPNQIQVGPQHVTTNNALWETWADDSATFPFTPDPSKCNVPNPPPNNCPVWPTAAAPAKILTASPKELIRQQIRVEKLQQQQDLFRLQEKKSAAPPKVQLLVSGSQETRRNKPGFDFIVQNNLWYQQGLKAAFALGRPISFPIDTIEIKADWRKISPAEKANYHWNYDSSGTLYGLIALHIISKAIPNWTWATFEWTGNPGRCDYIGCRDNFGSLPSYVPTNAQPDKGYAAGQLTPELLALFQAAGLSAEWQNYRLKGSQVDFTESTGKATRLGNSITEEGFVSSSSCLTCHSRAAVDMDGILFPDAGFNPDGSSPNGAPSPDWFYNTSSDPWTMKYLQLDFVWGFLRARPAPSP